jgi:phosphomannomutase
VRYVQAYAAEAPAGSIVVTRDGRTTGRMLADLVRGTLQATGREVHDADLAATPTTGVLVRQLQAAGGIQISASHNPPEYNGMKLFSPAGRVIPAEAGRKVVERYRAGGGEWVAYNKLGNAKAVADTTSAHWELIRQCVNVERIRQRKFAVLLDSNHGAGSVLGRRLLDELGCQVELVGGQPDGRFEHPPEPLAENLSGVRSLVTRLQADVGFCQDPDADRLAIIDEQGRYIGEEYTLAICANHVLSEHPGPVVTNCSTSRMTEDLANKYGVPFYRSAVGEANVVDVMLAEQATFGGEGNGGVIDPRVVLVRDSFVSMALVLDAIAKRELAVSRLVEELPRYSIVKTKIDLAPDRVAEGLVALQQRFGDAQSDRMDGLRLDWPGKWLLVRASNTEPIVRAIAEAPSQKEASQLCAEAAEVLGKLSK